MGMTVLILSTCMISDPEKGTIDPATCKDVELTYAEELNQMQCVMGAPPEIAKWVEGHPRWAVKKWKCEVRDEVGSSKGQDI